ncbi:unnamed protein product [Hermetia illucens]|uniref:Transcription factor CBF/NF-Y/archaeal histone domain-containing protein n=1 Tax=Hermetia illucens TaxID=343691 RepID=A0A7R8UBE8_HERIL|nr:chromatin accessibility complex 16kD protein [Hermetia illucens]CAD7077679.1 unnamed protein product [Hermetia illucens]
MSGSKAEDLNKSKSTEPAIALKRIRTIMRSTADTGPINSEGLFVVSKATKLFIEYLAKGSFDFAKSGTLSYDNLAKMVNENDKLEFLLPIIPQKITVREYKEILSKESDGDSSEEEEQSGEEEEAAAKSS